MYFWVSGLNKVESGLTFCTLEQGSSRNNSSMNHYGSSFGQESLQHSMPSCMNKLHGNYSWSSKTVAHSEVCNRNSGCSVCNRMSSNIAKVDRCVSSGFLCIIRVLRTDWHVRVHMQAWKCSCKVINTPVFAGLETWCRVGPPQWRWLSCREAGGHLQQLNLCRLLTCWQQGLQPAKLKGRPDSINHTESQ